MTKREFTTGLKAPVRHWTHGKIPSGKCLGHLGGGYLLFRNRLKKLVRFNVIGLTRAHVDAIVAGCS